MDARQFITEFGHIANAPGGVARLREMIYQLAITGSITPRGKNGEDAQILLVEVEATRQRLIRKKNYKRMLELEGEPTRIPTAIELPATWRWSRLLDVGEINPRNNAQDEVPAVFLPMSGVPQLHRGRVVTDTTRWNEIKKGYTHFASGDVVLAKITPCFENGKAAVIPVLSDAPKIGAGTTELHVFRPIHPGVLPEYVYLFLRSPLFVVEGEKSMTGTAGQKRLPTDFFATRAFPLPPTEEQSRIVAKVDELMALCDTLEAQQQQRRRLQNTLRQATLHAVATAASPHELHSTWTRLARNFGRLFQTPEDVRALRNVIFDLALRGMLLPTANTSSEAPGTDTPSLPAGWSWKTLGELSEYITSGSRGWKGYISATGDAFIRSQDIRNDALIFENPAFVTLPEKSEGKRTLVREGDLLLTITGGNVGKCARVSALSGNAYVSQHVALIRLADPELSEFVHFWMINAYGGRGFLARYIYGDKPGLNLAQVASVLVPVPADTDILPILESLRHYQAMCDRFEEQVKKKSDITKLLAISAVSSFTGITTKPEEEPMKTPQTELIAPLRLGQPPGIKAQAPLAAILARHNGEMGANDLWRRFGGEIDAFYAQLKTEVSHGWILEPAVAEMRVRDAS